ncbi:MAG: hypothetical protein IT459_13570 [Planctomycetes bacterium]|nr:hypothetical protein [Planctomycetota bacterium]
MRSSVVFSLVACAAVATFAFAPGPKGDGDRLRGLFKEKTRAVTPQQDLLPAKLATLLSASGIPSEITKEMDVYDVQLDGKDGTYRVVLMDLAWSRKAARFAVAVTPEGELHAASISDEFGKVTKDFDAFLAQFRGEYSLRLSSDSLKPMGDVTKLRDSIVNAAKPPLKPDEKLRYGLYLQRAQMWKFEEIERRIDEARKGGKPVEADLKALRTELERLGELVPHMAKTFKPKDLAAYKAFIEGMKTGIDSALASAAEGKAADADKVVVADVLQACGKCHGFDANAWRRPTATVLREEREKLTGKDGMFVVDFDVRRYGAEPEDAQVIASALKAALLIGAGKL